jgi:hypothetical protein
MTDLISKMEVEWSDVGIDPDENAANYEGIIEIVAPEALNVCTAYRIDSLVQLHLLMQGMHLLRELLSRDPYGNPVSADPDSPSGEIFEVEALEAANRVCERWGSLFAYLIPVQGRRTGISEDVIDLPFRDRSDWEWAMEALREYAEHLLASGNDLPPFKEDPTEGLHEAVFQMLRGLNFACEKILLSERVVDDYSVSKVVRDVRLQAFDLYFELLLDPPREMVLEFMEAGP